MSALFFLIVISIIFAGGFLFAFLWAVRNGQFDDKYTPSVRILIDEPPLSDETDSTHFREAD